MGERQNQSCQRDVKTSRVLGNGDPCHGIPSRTHSHTFTHTRTRPRKRNTDYNQIPVTELFVLYYSINNNCIVSRFVSKNSLRNIVGTITKVGNQTNIFTA